MAGLLLMLLAAAVLAVAVLLGGTVGAGLYALGVGLLLTGYAVARLRGVR